MKLFKNYLLLIIIFSGFLHPMIFEGLFIDDQNSSLIDLKLFQNNYPQINLSKLPKIDYDSHYYEWYHSKLEMLIITPENQSFIEAVTPLKEWKNNKGVKTIILSNFSLYEGRDKAEKIRNMIKSYYLNENIEWVLIAADATEDLIPTRHVYNPDTIEYSGSEYNGYDDYYKPTDFYYADLTGSWDEDGDGKWGESAKYNAHGKDEIDWNPEVYVGRLPASSAKELEIMVNKIIDYEKNPNIGDWMNRMLLAGGISDYSPAEDETRLTTRIIQNFIPFEMNYTHLCEYTSSFIPPDPKEPLNQNNFVNYFDSGFSTVFFAGHGNPSKFIRNPSNDLVYTNNNAQTSLNSNMTSLIYAFACTTSPIDQNDNNIGEVLIKRNNSGAIGYVGGMRITWYFEHDTKLEKLNRGNAKLFWKEFFVEKKFQQGKTLYDSKVAYMNSDYFDNPSVSMRLEYERKNVLTYCLLGDPELDIYTNIPVEVSNPFIDDIYEGQNVSLSIRNISNESVLNARIRITSNDGLYRTFYIDAEGQCSFIIPALKNKEYNITITGHNIKHSQFNFTTHLDTLEPEITNLQMIQNVSPEVETIYFTTEAYDLNSGIENVFLLFSNNSFENFMIYSMKKNTSENNNIYELFIKNLLPGKYSYLAVARDIANNIKILYDENFNFEVIEEIQKGNINLTYFFILLPTLGIIGISILLLYIRYQKKIAKERDWKEWIN